MPLKSTRGAASAKGFGFTQGSTGLVAVDYLVVAGGGSGGESIGSQPGPITFLRRSGGGGGAGGFRTSYPGGTSISLIPGTYPITIGGTGTNSIFDTITSAAGGKGGEGRTPVNLGSSDGFNGGSGGGGGSGPVLGIGGTGNTPPTSPPQGNNGSNGIPAAPSSGGGGGGGASATGGGPGGPGNVGKNGGNGTNTSISGSPVTYAGGGGGGSSATNTLSSGGTGGGGGGGGGSPSVYTQATAGTINTGGGGGGGGVTNIPTPQTRNGASGGSGIILILAPTASSPRISLSPGTNTKTAAPTGTLCTFTVTGDLTIS